VTDRFGIVTADFGDRDRPASNPLWGFDAGPGAA
jgi:hypothetical protein